MTYTAIHMITSIVTFFDKLEDVCRGKLSHWPIVYALIGGAAHVLFWRGVWHIADDHNLGSWTSIIIGTIVLLKIGLLVSSFIGNEIILSGLKGEKKMAEKTEEEVRRDIHMTEALKVELERLHVRLDDIEKKL